MREVSLKVFATEDRDESQVAWVKAPALVNRANTLAATPAIGEDGNVDPSQGWRVTHLATGRLLFGAYDGLSRTAAVRAMRDISKGPLAQAGVWHLTSKRDVERAADKAAVREMIASAREAAGWRKR